MENESLTNDTFWTEIKLNLIGSLDLIKKQNFAEQFPFAAKIETAVASDKNSKEGKWNNQNQIFVFYFYFCHVQEWEIPYSIYWV